MTWDRKSRMTFFGIMAFAVVNFVMHIAFYNNLGFHRDELLYFTLGNHPSAGYASVPPFTGWMAFLMINLLGPTLFAARLLPALCSSMLIFLTDGIVREMKGGEYSRIVAAIGIIIAPIYLRGFSLFQPVFFDIIFWTVNFYLLLRWINSGKDIFLILLGIAAGIGIMNKYLILLQIFCVAAVFALSKYRDIYTKKSLYIASLIALLIIMPNIIWQFSHHLPVITHMKALNESQLVHVSRISFLIDQIFHGFMASILIFPGLFFLLIRRNMKDYRPLALAWLFVILILLALRGKSYYTAGLFPFVIAAGAIYWERLMLPQGIRIAFILILVGITIPVIPIGIPVFKEPVLADYFSYLKNNVGFDDVLRDEDGNYHELPQDYADMIGWEELAMKAGDTYNQVPDKRSCFIYCENYGQAGAISILGKKYGLPEPVCFSESFFYWAPRKLPVEIKSAIYINDELGEDIRAVFRDCRVAGKITDPLAREYGTTIYFCKDPVVSFNKFYEQRVQEITSPF